MAIPHTIAAGIAKPAQPGWILFHSMRSHGPIAQEPEVITAEHIPFVPATAGHIPFIPVTPKAPSVSNGQPTKSASTSSIIPVLPFAKQHGFSYTQIMVFVAQVMPDLPRYHKAILLDDAAQQRLLRDFPPWAAARDLDNQRKSREAVALARAKRINDSKAKRASAAIQAKALSTFQSQHVTPAGNVERVMAAIAEVRDLVIMLAEDVAKLQAQVPHVNASQDGDA